MEYFFRTGRTCVLLLLIGLLSSCGDGHRGSGGGEEATSNIVLTDALSGDRMVEGNVATPFAKFTVGGTDSGTTAAFVEDGKPEIPLIASVGNPNQYWLPFVVTRTTGAVIISANGTPIRSMKIVITPFLTSGIPGEAIENYLESSLITRDKAIALLRAANDSPDNLQILEQSRIATQQLLGWITETKAKGTAIVGYALDDSPIVMSTDNLKEMDQMILWAASMARVAVGGKPAPTAAVFKFDNVFDLFIKSAYAQSASRCVPPGTSPARQEVSANDIAYCLAQVNAADADRVAAYMTIAAEVLDFAGNATLALTTGGTSALATTLPKVLTLLGTIVSVQADSISAIAQIQTGNYCGAVETVLQSAAKLLSGKFADVGAGKLAPVMTTSIEAVERFLKKGAVASALFNKFIEPIKNVAVKVTAKVVEPWIDEEIKKLCKPPITDAGFWEGSYTVGACNEPGSASNTAVCVWAINGWAGQAQSADMLVRLGTAESENIRWEHLAGGSVSVCQAQTGSLGTLPVGATFTRTLDMTGLVVGYSNGKQDSTTVFTVLQRTPTEISGSFEVTYLYATARAVGAVPTRTGTASGTWTLRPRSRSCPTCIDPPEGQWCREDSKAYSSTGADTQQGGRGAFGSCPWKPASDIGRPGEWTERN